MTIFGNIFDRFQMGGLLFHSGKEYDKSKTVVLMTDCWIISIWNWWRWVA